ncbi:MAG: Xaa-Pro peptidase family protein [Nitrososphaerota archaeon]
MSIPQETISKRLSKLRHHMKLEGIDLFVLQSRYNISYFCGLENISGHLFVTQVGKPVFYVIDKQLRQALDLGSIAVQVVRGQPDYEDQLFNEVAQELGGSKNIAFDLLDIANYQKMVERLGILPVLGGSIIRSIQRFYDSNELEMVRRAASIADAGFEAARQTLRPGVRELEVLGQMQYTFRKEGSEWDSFRVFGSGLASAYSEALPTNRVIKRGDMVFIDIGPIYKGYRADITRTYIVGEPSAEQRRILDSLVDVELNAIGLAKVGKKAYELDAQVRKLVTDRGFNDYLHHTGHALSGSFEIVPNSQTLLECNDVICLEPGIYVPGIGGGRIEDEILLMDNSVEILSHTSRDPYLCV